MKSICFYILCMSIEVCHSLGLWEGWNYINLHCRDNDNKPVDWWYLYKPSTDESQGPGRNFSFITPETVGRWEPSGRYINSGSMLQHTLAPLYRPTYSDYLAMIAYTNREDDGVIKGSSAHGLMIADQIGGLWIVHTVPGLLDLSGDRPIFPNKELESGHLIMCLSLDLPVLNLVAANIREVAPKVLQTRLPAFVRNKLPDWQNFNRDKQSGEKRLQLRPLTFLTTDKTLRAVLMVRRPKEKRCLYKAFAQLKRIVLDVYGHDKRKRPVCAKGYGVRNIDSISLKYPESVYYIENKTDKTNFAVSTAAHWQRRGNGPSQFWTCISSMESEDSSDRGGNIVCVQDYNLWWSFDNLKVREPRC